MEHLIHRQTLEFKFASKAQAQQWSPQLSELNQQVILPELVQLFAELTAAGQTLRIEQLEIDLGSLSPSEFRDELPRRLRSKLREALQDFPLQRADSQQAAAETLLAPAEEQTNLSSSSLFELLELFLHTGHLPWWLDKQQAQRLDAHYQELWRSAPQQARTLVETVLVGPLARRRFIEQFSNRSHQLTLRSLLPGRQATLLGELRKLAALLLVRRFGGAQARIGSFEAVYQLLSELDRRLDDALIVLTRQLFVGLAGWSDLPYAQLLDELDSAVGRSRISRTSRILVAQLLREDAVLADSRGQLPILRRNSLSPLREDEPSEVATAPALVEAAIENAGLVLLWPYLGELLRKLDLLDSINDPPRPKLTAVLLLQQLVTGRLAAQENRLLLNKLLCGVPLQLPVPRRLPQEDLWNAEVEALLNAVIGHWSALKNTSLAGFRSSFLQREGLLRETETGWQLQVERKAYDILLEQLPWGLGMIQFSWMRQPLRIEW